MLVYEASFTIIWISPAWADFPRFSQAELNVDFPRDHHFRYQPDRPRVKRIKLLGNFADKSKIRNTLAYEMIAASGSIAHFAFPVRVQQDGQFFCVAELVENGDERWLERVGRDPQGALYKMNNNLPEVTMRTRRPANTSRRATWTTLRWRWPKTGRWRPARLTPIGRSIFRNASAISWP